MRALPANHHRAWRPPNQHAGGFYHFSCYSEYSILEADTGDFRLTNGHIFGFGCTYDKTLREVKGVEECGRPQDGPFDHVTGHGWVKRFGPPAPSPTDPQRVMPGAQYYDAIHNKNNKVTLWLVEPTGAIHHEAVADLRRRARCATSAPSARPTQHRARRVGRTHAQVLPNTAVRYCKVM